LASELQLARELLRPVFKVGAWTPLRAGGQRSDRPTNKAIYVVDSPHGCLPKLFSVAQPNSVTSQTLEPVSPRVQRYRAARLA